MIGFHTGHTKIAQRFLDVELGHKARSKASAACGDDFH